MILWMIKVTILSIILIYLIHSLIIFFTSTLTVPKVKDLVNSSQKKYDKIINLLSQAENKGIDSQNEIISSSDMKKELKNFFKSQIDSMNTSTPIESLDNTTLSIL